MDVGEMAAHLRTRLSALAPGQAWFDIACGMGNGRIRSTESQWLNCLIGSKKEECHKHCMSRPRDNAERVRSDQFTEASVDQLRARELSRSLENLLSRTPRTRQPVSKDSARDRASVLDYPLDQKGSRSGTCRVPPARQDPGLPQPWTPEHKP